MDNKFEASQTFENLKKAFEDEAKLYFRYKFFLSVSEYEGLGKISKTLRDFSEGSLDNVNGSLDFLRNFKDPSSQVPIGNSSQNIASILQTEIEQANEIYPEMAKIARDEGFSDVASWFDTLEKLKRHHVSRLKENQSE
ncbi:MAG: ferritin family protein [Bacteriovorax sp.]|nr:ferritin family protein [Bacteriovorax sp.]